MPTTKSRLNLHLWLVTGRQGDFQSVALNSPVVYTTQPDPLLDEVRALLWVGDTRTDQGILALMAAMESASAEVDLPPDMPAYHMRGAIPAVFPSIEGAEIIPSGAEIPRAGYFPRVYPFAYEWRLTFNTDHLVLSNDAGQRYRMTYRATGTDLFPTWPTELGFDFGLRFGSTWAGEACVFRLPIRTFPFEPLAERLKNSPAVARLLGGENVGSAFSASVWAFHRVGLVVAAVASRAARLTDGISPDGATCEVVQDDEVTGAVSGASWKIADIGDDTETIQFLGEDVTANGDIEPL